MDLDDDDSPPRALGTVAEEGRGAAPFALVHGEAQVACAAWALGAAGVALVDLGTPWVDVAEAGTAYVVHDALCPMTPAGFIADCVRLSARLDAVVVGTGPEGHVWSPVVLPARVVAALDAATVAVLLRGPDLTAAVDRLVADEDSGGQALHRVGAPPEARRVSTDDERRELEAATVAGRRG